MRAETVEERPFQGCVMHVESARASAPVVAVPRQLAFFRNLFQTFPAVPLPLRPKRTRCWPL